MCELACRSEKGFFCPALPFGQRVYSETENGVECPENVENCKAAYSSFVNKSLSELYIHEAATGRPNSISMGSRWKRTR